MAKVVGEDGMLQLIAVWRVFGVPDTSHQASLLPPSRSLPLS